MERRTTKRPSPLRSAPPVSLSACVPSAATLTRSVRGVGSAAAGATATQPARTAIRAAGLR
ncbi:hypothetical protein [Streptomyces alboverticillatus]|uniref:hypothetical protein n=1 Tax=Streptomyces alboverticillatus TaxID=173770 RepID=UPI00117E75F0|nr:hypothetical protein [Streptomyces alboverticillatus]